MDTAVKGSEFSPDFIWESAGKITDQGYQVEICLPLRSINFKSGKNAFFGIARGKYSLNKDNYFGVLYSGREFAGGYNRVFGADFGYRLFKNHKINTSFLQSMSGKSRNSEVIQSSDF